MLAHAHWTSVLKPASIAAESDRKESGEMEQNILFYSAGKINKGSIFMLSTSTAIMLSAS